MKYPELVAAIFHGRPGEPFQCHGLDDQDVDPDEALFIVWEGDDPAPTLKEIEAWSTEVCLEAAQLAKCDEAKAALTDSDVWVIRQVEDGISLTPERLAYRQELRGIVDQAQASDDPAEIALPTVPAFKPTKPS